MAGTSTSATEPGAGNPSPSGGSSSGSPVVTPTSSSSSSGGADADAGVVNVDNGETDVGCGGPNAPKCTEGKKCKVDSDCEVACNYANVCVSAPSCVVQNGGDTCGFGEVGDANAKHESCCRSLPVTGYSDPMNPGKTVYLDKYEITAGRVRQWIASLAAANNGQPNVAAWIAANRPAIWDDSWNQFLPTGFDGPTLLIGRRLLGDVRVEDGLAGNGPGVILPPTTDQNQNLGVNYQFGSEVYVDLHGSDCATWNGSYGFPTYYYSADILARDTELPRADAVGYSGETLKAQDFLDVKSMNCITNEMLAAFCAWDGGQLVTDEVLDFITQTPATLGSNEGCGTQYDSHGNLLGNHTTPADGTVQTGGKCADVDLINATFDGGDDLPVPGSFLNMHNYHYPDLGDSTSDKVWEIGAPGRASLATAANNTATDAISLSAGAEPWMDLAGNLNEAALSVSGGKFTGLFALKYRGIAYGTARSDLNFTQMKGETVLRYQRPEAKAAYTGGRCMRFK